MVKDEEMLEELRKIRALLEPKPVAAAPAPPKGLWAEFKDFISKYKVMGLAVAFIIGLYLGVLIQSLVKDLLLPAIGLAIPGLAGLGDVHGCSDESDVRCWQFSGGFDNFRDRCVRDLCVGEGFEEVGH